MLVDLHTHSYYSDGTLAPREIIEEAKRKNIQAIAITDHDEIGSYKEAKEAADQGTGIGVVLSFLFARKSGESVGSKGVCQRRVLLEAPDTAS